jgi:dephospho-CoA kinase
MKILLIGHARHGKDTVSEMLQQMLGLTFRSSSEFVNESVVFPVLAPKYGYTTLDECYQDRVNHRQEWYELLRKYNGDDPARLGRELFEENDIYCGLRHREEFEAMKDQSLFDVCIWVDASKRLPLESTTSMTLERTDANIVIDNNQSLKQLYDQMVFICSNDILYFA